MFLSCWDLHISVINIPITGNFPAVAAIVFYDFRQIIVYGIKFKPVVSAPVYSVGKSIADSTGPEDEFATI